MIASSLLLIGKALGLLLFSIASIFVVWAVCGVIACVVCCGLGCGCRGLCTRLMRPWAHYHG